MVRPINVVWGQAGVAQAGWVLNSILGGQADPCDQVDLGDLDDLWWSGAAWPTLGTVQTRLHGFGALPCISN